MVGCCGLWRVSVQVSQWATNSAKQHVLIGSDWHNHVSPGGEGATSSQVTPSWASLRHLPHTSHALILCNVFMQLTIFILQFKPNISNSTICLVLFYRNPFFNTTSNLDTNLVTRCLDTRSAPCENGEKRENYLILNVLAMGGRVSIQSTTHLRQPLPPCPDGSTN